jgi:acetyltransferase-like isoleucine patch superfamily enzyme
MAFLPLRQLQLPEPTQALYDSWLDDLDRRLDAPGAEWPVVVRDTLLGLFYPGIADWSAAVGDARRPLSERAALLALDPRNITLEPEYYADVDPVRFARVKPLLWLWYSFDRTPLAGQNVALGVALRRRLAPRIFARCGRNFKCFQHVEFSYGYNIEAGDDVVIHRHVLLDDRGGLTLGDRVSVSDYANIYSHTHSIVDQRDVTNARTILEDDVRITYHATVLAGVRVGRNGMVGASAVATKNVRPYHVNVGIPAKSVRVKPNAPPDATSTDLTDRRAGGPEPA